MKRILFILMILLLMRCDIPLETVNTVEDTYLCNDYQITNENNYSFDKAISYKLRLIQLKKSDKESTVSSDKVIANLNKRLKATNISFVLASSTTQVIDQFNVKKTRYREMLGSYYDSGGIGFITMIIVPNDIQFETSTNIGGAALGIPDLDDNAKGKPIFFVRRKYSTNQVAIHEVLHTLSLKHVFFLNEYIDDGYSCKTGDEVIDTPIPAPGFSIGHETCKFYPGNGDNLTDDEKKILVANFLNYSPPWCMVGKNTLTEGQIQKVRKMASINPLLQVAEVNDKRYDLFTSE